MQIQDFVSRLSNVKGGPSQFTAKCPAHPDRHNSLSVGLGEDGRILLKCHAGCDTLDILRVLNVSLSDLFTNKDGLVEKRAPRAQVDKVKPLPENANSAPARLQEGPHGEVNLQKCKMRDKQYQYEDAAGFILFEVVRIQYEDGSKTFRQRHKDSEGKWLYTMKGVEPVLYHLPQVRRQAAAGLDIYLCEGEKDTDRLVGLGLCATTAPMGAGKWKPQYTESLAGARRVYILPDNDKAGRGHALLVSRELTAAGIENRIVDLKGLYPPLPRKGDVYDVLEALGDGVAEQLAEFAVTPQVFEDLARTRDLVDDAPPYQFDSAARYLEQEFWLEIEKNKRAKTIHTGFGQLDKQLDGGLYSGLYVIGSVSSLGKTAFCLQMADSIAAQNIDVLFFTLEMSRLEMVARSLARTLFCQHNFQSQYGIGHILHDRVEENDLEAAAQAYHQKTARHISFVEGAFGLTVEDVISRVMLHYGATGRRPVVFVDYLQILRPPDIRMTDKQAMDYNVIQLKRLSRDLDVPVLAVSSFNRQNYSEEVNMASFKESGAIEYSADFVLGLQARGISGQSEVTLDEKKLARMVKNETKSAKQQDPRPIEAVTLKNRRGPAWACFELDFYPKQNFFQESYLGYGKY